MSAQQNDGAGKPDAPVPQAVAPGELKFGAGDGFLHEVRHRVDQYFKASGRRRRDCPQMYVKSVLVLGWFVASYALLVFVAGPWWLVLPLALSLGLSMAAIGFNIQHDGGHGSYSERRWVNRLAALTLDLLGGSSYIWARKHNTIHHSYANITGHDEDINVGLLGRVSPHHRRFGFHRLQHFYLWVLYGLLPVKWQFYDDYRDVLTGRIGGYRLVRPRGWDLVTFVAGKLTFLSLALVIPLWLHPVWVVVLCYAAASFVQGLALSIVFQLAHCVEGADFPLPQKDTGRMESAWASHQVETAVDFARGGRLISWFVGGLNFQIEHHLFPGICHIHYPALAPLVEEVCKQFGLKYRANGTFRAGVASHFRWLRRMGRADAAQDKGTRAKNKLAAEGL